MAKTAAQIIAEIAAQFPDNSTGAITPAILRSVTSDIVNSIMPTAPVTAGGLPSFDGTTGLLKDSGVVNGSAQWIVGQLTVPPANVRFQISDNPLAPVAPMSGITPQLLLGNTDGQRVVLQLQGSGNGEPSLILASHGGPPNAATASPSGTFLEFFGHFYAVTATPGFVRTAGGGFIIRSTENITTTSAGTAIDVYNTPTGTGVTQPGATFQSSGGFSVGTGTDPGLGNINMAGGVKPGSFTVGTLPTGATGLTVFASNCRMFNGTGTQEGAGVGTGGIVSYNGTAWKIAGTNVTAVA